MTRSRSLFVCQNCGAECPKWAGQCADCGQWNVLVEAPVPGRGARRSASAATPVRTLATLEAVEAPRRPSGLAEMDRVLGGGIVPGAVILIGGDPGIGKSTLLMQIMGRVHADLPVLYVTGEESLAQVGLRARRLDLGDVPLPVLTETSVEQVLSAAAAQRPRLLVVDSIQTLQTDALDSAPGSVSQLRECAAQLVRYAKSSDTTVVLVGHVTKEGAIAGPRVLEHMVDTVLYFEQDAGSRFRIIRAVKNRFGAVNELGVFAMTDGGLREVGNPSALFLSGHEQAVSGSVVTVTRQGTRPMLVEVQALVDGPAAGTPRRVALGLEHNRLSMLLAVLHRQGGVALGDHDVFVNAVGGMRINEPGADLPMLLAVASSFRDRAWPADTVVFGEVGLAGEVRPVAGGEERLAEAAKQGFKRAVVPRANRPRKAAGLDIEVRGITRLQQALGA